ncbi:NAD-dependent epimerase/dehydratase family protein [Gemmata sp. G18]|uniref:NAD-dependent epimerase/dehydratase family protein n=1 Tax=Gemmata palustris TaxID=2822762 RepID=A0ABS5BR63_9BACT|nr:NAD-dependent epimerase/dehydratase family protein [Gemmata palustris]MBP3956215.1 NAD-dependent epimerase/dehydratase family protein [Gemmata palustris]
MSAPPPPFWTGTPVCVLGGNGFLGRHIVGALLRAGARVRTLSLPGPALGDAHPNLDAHTGDVTDPAAARAAVEGARVVFLAAGPVGAGGKVARGMGTHPDALASVLGVLPGDARLVLTSSIVAVGAGRGEVRTEDSPFPNARLRVNYVHAKRAAEESALVAAKQRDVLVVNPGYLFGPDDPGPSVMGDLCVRFWRGNVAFALPGGINAVDVRDVAAGHLLAAERGASGRRYILGGENVRFTHLFAALARAGGMQRAFLRSFKPALPRSAWWAMAALAELGSRVSGKDPRPSFEFVRMFQRCWFVSSARAEAELGYRARPLSETLADAFAWHAARTRVAPRGLNKLWLRRS